MRRSYARGVQAWFRAAYAKYISHKWALLILLGALLVHFWYIFINFTTALYGGPGDHTASLIWLYEQSPSSPWWGFTDMSASPFGELLWSPVYLLGQAVYILFWIFASIFQSGIAGYNTLTIAGYIFSFISVYCVATKFFRRRPLVIGLFAYVATFTPFVMALNAVGHLSYIFAPGYVAILAYLVIQVFAQKATLMRLASIGAISGLSWLIDPYYVLFSSVLVCALGLAIFIANKTYSSRTHLKKFLKNTAVISGAWILCMLPLGVYSYVISSTVSDATSVRADIQEDAQQYSARFVDFLLPSAQNPLAPAPVVTYKESTYHGSDPTFTLYAGVVLVIFLAISLVWYFVSKQTRYRLYIVSTVGTAAVLLLFSLPPVIEIFGLRIPGPSGFVIAVTDTWRVFARFFIFAFPLLILAATGLSLLLLEKRRMWLRIVVGCVLVLMPLDMLYRNPFNPDLFWSMGSDISSNYQLVSQDPSIQSLAEYPLREAPHYKGSLYFTAQLMHEKRIMNPMMISTGEESKIRRSLIDLSNPQTIPALKFLGVNAVQVWGSVDETSGDLSGVNLLATDVTSTMFGEMKGELYKINSSVQAQRYVVYMQGTGQIWNDATRDIEEGASGDVIFTILDLCEYYKSTSCNEASDKIRHTISMDIVNHSNESVSVELVTSEGRRSTILSPGVNSVTSVTKTDVKISTSAPIGVKNYRVEGVAE